MKTFSKKLFLSLGLFGMLYLSSCSGGGGESAEGKSSNSGSSSSDTSVTTNASVNEELVVAEEEIAEISSALNDSETYQLDQDELELLLAENAISQEEYNELLSLIK